MSKHTAMTIEPMARDEFDILVEWAAREGWNPGVHDADIFWHTDPQGFIVARLDGEMVGGGSIVSYGGHFGFMGFFIMKPELRGRGLGTRLWYHRRDALLERLRAPAVIGMDGVFAMQPFYTRGGFTFFTREPRFEGIGVGAPLAPSLVDLVAVPLHEVIAYDSAHFPAPRPEFVKRWITQPDARALGVVTSGRLCGYGVIRACRRGFKIGPLFADTSEYAEDLFVGLADFAAGQPVFLDTPEINPAAVALARRHGMREVFGCARMYLGPIPELPHAEIFGVTTFELG